nr:hypothetical protein [Tanacetum cinerariifolium]
MVYPTNNGNIEDVQPSVVPTEYPILNSEPVVTPIIELVASLVSASRPNQRPSIPYPSRLHDQKLFPLRVVIPFRSSFGLVIVLPGRVSKPKDEAAEESRVDEPKLGKPELDKLVLDKLVLDKLEVGFNLAFSAAISVSKDEVIELDDSLR